MRGRSSRLLLAILAFLVVGVACTNDPYPGADRTRKVFYTSFVLAPKSLDPAVAYDTAAHAVTGNVYDALLEYHYLKRPYLLIPSLAKAVPRAQTLADGRLAYTFRIRKGLLFHSDPCFELSGRGLRTREVIAADFAFELMRLADPAVASPVVRKFFAIAGFAAFHERLKALQKTGKEFTELPAHQQYARAGGISGIEIKGRHTLRMVLARPDPQILYWFAMPFTTPVPWEAVQYYDGRNGRPNFRDHPVGTGPYRMELYEKQHRMVLVRNANWYGVRHPEWQAPGAVYPSTGEAVDRTAGRLNPAYVGRTLPFIERIEFRRDKESIPRFTKFLQGYYDRSGIIKESFDQIVQNEALSPAMAKRGMRLEKTVEPSIFYVGFNMLDKTVGRAAGERARKLRQAMSLAIDAKEYARVFQNGRGVPAQSPVPPGLFGYDPGYRNPYRTLDLKRARALLAAAGYRRGIDPRTGKPLVLTLDTGNTQAQAMLRYQFFINAWRRIGLDVQVKATNYNQYLQKLKVGAYQLYYTGWIADFPDPENFLFLLESSSGRKVSGGSNYSNFSNLEYDALYRRMRVLRNGPERRKVITEMIAILEYERPWIEIDHREAYTLVQPWLRNAKSFGLSYPTLKYLDIDTGRRAALRKRWNQPVLWPIWVLLGLLAAFVAPGVVTFFRERT